MVDNYDSDLHKTIQTGKICVLRTNHKHKNKNKHYLALYSFKEDQVG